MFDSETTAGVDWVVVSVDGVVVVVVIVGVLVEGAVVTLNKYKTWKDNTGLVTKTYLVALLPSPLSVFSGCFGLVTITTMNFFSSILYSEIALSSVKIFPEIYL